MNELKKEVRLSKTQEAYLGRAIACLKNTIVHLEAAVEVGK
jgi:hypothetical protein